MQRTDINMSRSPTAGLVRRAIDLNYANKQRAAAFKWILFNAALFLLFTYDLSCKCPGYTSAMHYAELCCAAAAALSALAHARRLLPRRVPPVPLSRDQQRLLGLKDEDLDSSFHVSSRLWEEPPRAPRDESPPATLSPPHSWRSPRASPSPPAPARSRPASPPSPPAPAPDEFIASRRALADYIRAAEERAADADADGACWPPCALLPPAHLYQLAPLQADGGAAEESGAGGGGGGGGAHLWRRLHVDPQHLTQLNLNLRLWLHVTVLARLVRELDACDAALRGAGMEARAGGAAPARLAAAAAVAAPPLAARLRGLLPFLRPYADQEYLVGRVRALARGGCLSEYRWSGGGGADAGWSEARPSDAELVLHLFATYLDRVVPGAAPPGGGEGGAFSAAHVSAAPAPPPRAPHALVIHRVTRHPPHYVLVLGDDVVEVCRGRNNLLHTILLFLAAVARREPPALQRLHLGPAGLNMLWILGR